MTNLEKFLYNLIKQNQANNEDQFIVGQIFEAIVYSQHKYDDPALYNYVKGIASLINTEEHLCVVRIRILKPHLDLNLENNFSTFGTAPKINCIKIIRKVSGLGLKEAKEESERFTPFFVDQTFLTKQDAREWIEKQIEEMAANPYASSTAFLHNFFEIV